MGEPGPPPRFVPASPFLPAAGAQGPHVQTILGALLRPARPARATRQRWETPDGDFLDVDRVAADPAAPHLLLLHGLEGSSRAGYVLETLRGAAQRGWGAWALNFRSCSGEPNRLARSYNSGDPTDALFVIGKMREQGIGGPILGVGFSLGGSVLLNLLAATGADSPLHAAAAISAPFDLDACADLLDRGPGLTRLYKLLFLKSLKAKSLHRCRLQPGLLDPEAIRRARDIRTFDGLVSAPLFGFSSAEEYYRRCSSGPQLHAVRRPTLLVTAKDDPIAPAGALPPGVKDNPWLSLAITSRGGHVGFISGSLARPAFWGEAQALAFFDHLLAPVAGGPPEN